jgi:hypothetical protein
LKWHGASLIRRDLCQDTDPCGLTTGDAVTAEQFLEGYVGQEVLGI